MYQTKLVCFVLTLRHRYGLLTTHASMVIQLTTQVRVTDNTCIYGNPADNSGKGYWQHMYIW